MYACTKDQPKPEPVAASASASAAAAVAASASVAATDTAAPSASVADTAAASASAPVVVKGTSTAPVAKTELPGAAGSNAKGTNYEVVVPAPKTCDKGADCMLVARVTAGPGFHVNKEYPTKLVFDTAPNMDMLGTDAKGKNVFSMAAGNFIIDGETTGTMNAKMKPNASGLQNVAGTFTFSVCSASNCQKETAKVTATIPVR